MTKILISTSASYKSQKRIDFLEKLLLKAKDYYYNRGKFLVFRDEEITNAVYDKYEEELRDLNPRSKVLRTVRAKTKAPGRKTVKLPFYLGSLDKMWARSADTDAWLEEHSNGNFVISDKLDGYSVPIVCKNGQWSIYSAGDDNGKAMDISHLADYIDLPKVNKDIAVRGELIISRKKFQQYGSEFKNSRNMVASIVTRIKPHESSAHFDFVAHELLHPRVAPSKQFALLKKLGFKVVPHLVVAASKVTQDKLISFLKTRKAKSRYEIDGIVIAEDKSVPLTVGSNPTSVIAFKDNETEEIVTATVVRVDWEPSKHGFLKPVAIIRPVEISGVTVSKATGKNAYTIVNGWPKKLEKKYAGKKPRPIGPGAKVKLVRSGGVIPDILEVLKPATSGKPQMPKVAYKWNATGVDIVESVVSDTSLDKKMATFFRTMGVENLDVSTIAKLRANGLNSIRKILSAKPATFMSIPGVQEKSARRLYESIQAKMHDVPLHVLMDASGIFGRGVGQRKILPVIKKYPKILNSGWSVKKMQEKLLEVDGYSDKTAQQFAQAFPLFLKWLAVASKFITWKMPVEAKKRGDSMADQVVVFTGFRDKGLETLIGQHGGKIASGVSSKTTILLVSNLSDNGLKVKKAKELGTIKIMTSDQLVKRFKIK